MNSQLRFILIVFYLTATLLFSVHIRTSGSRGFYKLRKANVIEGRLKQELWQKQLQLESLINPAVISQSLTR